MKYEELKQLLDAGFTKNDLVNMGLIPAAPAAETPAEAPAAEAPAAEAPAAETPAAEPEQPGLDAMTAFTKLIQKMDARLEKLQSANIMGVGMQTPEQSKTPEQILADLVYPDPTKED